MFITAILFFGMVFIGGYAAPGA
ncbi:hypothetical protein KCP75_09140 [Salmonella enterica subsp. enterica]|nr:hypothetical protein KCP75_09140 [Salmonella enterica subsp. enterica]